jgi:hypothetical protein
MSSSEKFPHGIDPQPDEIWLLPSGKEVPFFDWRQHESREIIQYRRADTCDACNQEQAVVAVVKECISEDRAYLVDFVCKCCGNERVNVLEWLEALEQFHCVSSREELRRSNMSDQEIKDFVAALAQDVILPEDF